jgi:hypothetical protein
MWRASLRLRPTRAVFEKAKPYVASACPACAARNWEVEVKKMLPFGRIVTRLMRAPRSTPQVALCSAVTPSPWSDLSISAWRFLRGDDVRRGLG